MRASTVSLLASVLLACSAMVHAAIFDADDRVLVSTAPGSPFSPIGLVTHGGFRLHYTTGTLVDECNVLTSQHILGRKRSPLGARLRFTGAVGTRQQVSSNGTVVAAGGYEKHDLSAARSQAVGKDWLLLRLDVCLGSALGFAKLGKGPPGADGYKHLESAGYPIDRNRHAGLAVDPSCSIRKVYTLVFLNDCAALPGNSGGPIFKLVRDESGRAQLEIYAIQSEAYIFSRPAALPPGYENMATPVAGIVASIAPFL